MRDFPCLDSWTPLKAATIGFPNPSGLPVIFLLGMNVIGIDLKGNPVFHRYFCSDDTINGECIEATTLTGEFVWRSRTLEEMSLMSGIKVSRIRKSCRSFLFDGMLIETEGFFFRWCKVSKISAFHSSIAASAAAAQEKARVVSSSSSSSSSSSMPSMPSHVAEFLNNVKQSRADAEKDRLLKRFPAPTFMLSAVFTDTKLATLLKTNALTDEKQKVDERPSNDLSRLMIAHFAECLNAQVKAFVGDGESKEERRDDGVFFSVFRIRDLLRAFSSLVILLSEKCAIGSYAAEKPKILFILVPILQAWVHQHAALMSVDAETAAQVGGGTGVGATMLQLRRAALSFHCDSDAIMAPSAATLFIRALCSCGAPVESMLCLSQLESLTTILRSFGPLHQVLGDGCVRCCEQSLRRAEESARNRCINRSFSSSGPRSLSKKAQTDRVAKFVREGAGDHKMDDARPLKDEKDVSEPFEHLCRRIDNFPSPPESLGSVREALKHDAPFLHHMWMEEVSVFVFMCLCPCVYVCVSG